MCRCNLCRLFYSGFTASQSTLFCEAKYSVLHFAHKPSVLLRICFQSFSLRYALKSILKKYFQLVSDFIFLPPSFCFTLRFCSYESTKDKLPLCHIWTFASRFAGVLCKSFLSSHYNWKVPRRLSGYFTKILQKNCREIFPTTACKKEVRLFQTSFFAFIFKFFA